MKISPFLDTIERAIFKLEIGENMKKLCFSILASLALTLGLVSQVQADEYLRVGMEAAYAPREQINTPMVTMFK